MTEHPWVIGYPVEQAARQLNDAGITVQEIRRTGPPGNELRIVRQTIDGRQADLIVAARRQAGEPRKPT